MSPKQYGKPQQKTVSLLGERVSYTLTRKAVKNLNLRISREGKVSLSIKETMQKGLAGGSGREGGRPQQRSYAPRSYNRPAPIPSTGDAFEDMLNRYKRSSDDRMSDLKRVLDTRRGSANRRSRGR